MSFNKSQDVCCDETKTIKTLVWEHVEELRMSVIERVISMHFFVVSTANLAPV